MTPATAVVPPQVSDSVDTVDPIDEALGTLGGDEQ